MNKVKSIKVLSIIVTIAGFGLTMLSNYVDDKKLDEKIDESVKAALSQKDDEESEI